MTVRPCPLGHGALAPVSLSTPTGPVSLCACGDCDGMWWPEGALARWMQTPHDLAYPDPESVPAAATSAWVCPDDPGVCLVRVPYAPLARLSVLRCPYCAGLWVARNDLAPLRALADVRARRVVAAEAAAPPPLVDPDAPVMPPLSLRHRALSLPAALAWALLWRALPFGRLLPGGVRVPLHELGHATAAWATGHFAVPIPLGLTLSSDDRSVVVIGGCAAVALGVSGYAVVRRRWGVAALALGLWGVQLALTFGLDRAEHRALLLWAGCAGELVLSALLAASFYARMRPRLRWDLARWLAFPVGVYVLLDQSLTWWSTRTDPDRIPWGGAFSTDGDMDQLHTAFGWSEAAITRSYLRLAAAAFVLLALVWATSTARAWWRTRDRAAGATLPG